MTRALQNSLTFDVTFKVYDYTESYGEYINDNVYGVSHNNSIKEILDPTMKQYDAQIQQRLTVRKIAYYFNSKVY